MARRPTTTGSAPTSRTRGAATPSPDPEPPPKDISSATASPLRPKGALSAAHLPEKQRKAITDAQKAYRIALNSEDRTTDRGRDRIARAREAFYAARAAAGIVTAKKEGGTSSRSSSRSRPKSTAPAAPNPPAKPGMGARAAKTPATTTTGAKKPRQPSRTAPTQKTPATEVLAPSATTVNGQGERFDVDENAKGVPGSQLSPPRAVPKPAPGRQRRKSTVAPA